MKQKNISALFYFLLGATAAVAFVLANYWILRRNSSLGLLFTHNSLSYLIWYIGLTGITAVFFGTSVVLFIHQWRQFRFKNFFSQSGSGIGAILGIFASSCPICGSTVLSAIGIAGGLSSFPFQGLGLKALSLLLVSGSVMYARWSLKKKQCVNDSCSLPINDALNNVVSQKERLMLIFFLALLGILLILSFFMIRTDLIFAQTEVQQSYICGEP